MASPSDERYGWIGLGNMGLAMASNLQRFLSSRSDQPSLAYTNRTLSRGEPLAAMGAKGYATPGEVVAVSDVIFISLSDDAAILDLIHSLTTATATKTSPPSQVVAQKVFVDTTTIAPSTSTTVSDLITSHSGVYIAAPVFGATPVAVAGQLLFALGGPSPVISNVKPVIQACLGREPVIIAGPSPRDATLLKATGNFITAAMAQTLSEAHVLAEKAGLDDKVVGDLVRENYGAYAYSISRKLMDGVYAPESGQRARSDVRLAVKDVGIGIRVAESVGADLSLGRMCLQGLEEARRWGEVEGRELDSSAVYGVVRERSGLGFERVDVIEERKLTKEDSLGS